VAKFVPWGVVVFDLDDTIKRRRCEHIRAKAIYHDPVRSSHSHVVNVRDLRWLCCMLLTPMKWARRIWALPLMMVLCPSERFDEPQSRRHQALVERAWHIIHVVVRWLPGCGLAFVADRRDAVLEWLNQVSKWPRAGLITRLRLDAALYNPPPAREQGQFGRPRLTGDPRPTLEAVLADDATLWSKFIIEPWYGDAPREVEVATDTAVW
jgi:hypothetical protein